MYLNFASRRLSFSLRNSNLRKFGALPEVSSATRRKNLVTALVLIGFVGFVYNMAISKMKQKVR